MITSRGKEGIARVIFCVLPGSELVMLSAFIKKSRKTPKKEIAIAKRRIREVMK